MFELKRQRTLKLCMNHHLVDLYKFCTQDAPGLITGPVLGLRHLYVGIFQPITLYKKILRVTEGPRPLLKLSVVCLGQHSGIMSFNQSMIDMK